MAVSGVQDQLLDLEFEANESVEITLCQLEHLVFGVLRGLYDCKLRKAVQMVRVLAHSLVETHLFFRHSHFLELARQDPIVSLLRL